MSCSVLAAASALALVVALTSGVASAHAVCGSRVFPATLGIDDPGVSDELALPTVTYLPTNGDGVTYQVSLEAILPINNASGRGVGVVGELHFFLDDLFPDTIGKPLFGANKP